MPIEPEIDPKRVEMLDAAVSWVELATRNLVKIWSGRGDETPGFTLTWEALERWLAEFVQIAHTPAGRIDSAFRDLLRKLDDDAFAHTPLAQVVRLIRSDEIAIKLFLTVLVAPTSTSASTGCFGALHDDLATPLCLDRPRLRDHRRRDRRRDAGHDPRRGGGARAAARARPRARARAGRGVRR